MRILNVILDRFPTFRPDIVALFGRYLPRYGIHTDLVAQSTGGTDTEAEWGGGRVILSRRSGTRSLDQLRAFWHDVRNVAMSRRGIYDAIQIRDKVFVAAIAVWVGRIRRLPVFYWMSFPMSRIYSEVAREAGMSLGVGRWLFLTIKGRVGGVLLERYVLPRCAHVFVQSDRMRDEVAARGLSRERLTPVPMGVDLERRIPTRREALHDDRLRGRRVIAYLGSFEKPRRLEFLIEVLQQLAVIVPDIVLLMVGDGTEPDDRGRLERAAQSLGISERIVWTGWVRPDDAWRWLANADVAVSIVPRGALYDVASPTKVVEYMALGIPAVATDQPDQKKLIEESGAGVCCQMNHAAFVAALHSILVNPDVADTMRKAGPQYVATERSYDRIAASVATVYYRHAGPGACSRHTSAYA
jgi:glycosyltransferase involved in cell wall biosynthesis